MGIISDITKSVYSCKNVVYKGRRRVLLAKFFSKNEQKDAMITDSASINKVTTFKMANIKVIIFDSAYMEKEGEKSATKYSLRKIESEPFKDDDVDEMIKEDDEDLLEDMVDNEHQKHFKD